VQITLRIYYRFEVRFINLFNAWIRW